MRHVLPLCLFFVALTTAAAPASADELELTTGEVLQGEVRSVNDEQVVFQHPVLGELTLLRTDVARITQVEVEGAIDEAAEAEAVEVADVEAPVSDMPEIAPEQVGFFAGWDSQLSLGFSGTSGDTRTASVNTQFRSRKEDERDRWIIDSAYFYGKDGSNTTQNEFRAELTKDWLIPDSPWFFFANGRYQFDQFRPWRHRLGAHGGLGYEFVKREDLEIVGRIGAGTIYEVRGENSGFTPEALLGASVLRWNITENQTLVGSATLFPNLEDLGEFRLDTAVEWIVKINQADGLSVKLGLENQYDSDPGSGGKHNNLKYYGAVVFDF